MQNINVDLNLIYSIITIAVLACAVAYILIILKRKKLPNKKAAKKLMKNKWFWIIMLGSVLLIIYTFFLSPGNIQYYQKWSECGQPPIEGRGTFGSNAIHYVDSSEITPFRIYMSDSENFYFCSPKEAELNGYSSNPNQYEFEYTTAAERAEHRKEHGRIE
ncbi:MAG: hypothetical protein L0H36_02360 [bacterium]|nr:hypothetical protein [bacterium]